MSGEKRANEGASYSDENKKQDRSEKGVAHLKPEYVVLSDKSLRDVVYNDDEDEPSSERMASENGKGSKNKKKKRGQNKNRDNRQVKEDNVLCPKYLQGYSDSGEPLCTFGDKCRFVHDISEYLSHKKPELECEQFKICPVFEAIGYCPMGFKCRFLSSHFDKENTKLVKAGSEESRSKLLASNHEVNHITGDGKFDLIKRRFPFTKSLEVLDIIEAIQNDHKEQVVEQIKAKTEEKEEDTETEANKEEGKAPQVIQREKELEERRAHQRDLYLKYKDTRYFAQEKKTLDFRGKKIVSPLTTVGNLPYRRLMRKLGADVTYSEMALGLPLIQGTNSEWALPKAHVSETPGFGVQIACSKAWQAAKATEALVKNTQDISEINLNSGCPIDLLYRQGAGSALLDNAARMIRCLNAMSYVSDTVPVTVKIRTGTRDSHPVADTLVKRLVFETDISAITLHGRSRQQRYTRVADWDYVSKTAKSLRDAEIEFQESAVGKEARESQKRIQFVGNGDINNFEDWHRILQNDSNIDSIMVARGALIKPWIFEEIEAQQHLDKSSSERLDILKDYSRFAMEHWGADEYGIAQSRRFFCEFMSFFHRYVPIGICERYPVQLNERPPNWKGRNDLETLMGSTDSRDWIKLSEMFFGTVEDTKLSQ